jgi:hypothetical protein
MPTSAGSSETAPEPWRLGPYEVGGQLGAGGMGEVYRAHDSRLRRDVALKVLPPAFAQDPDRMARFAREAQVLAAMNHPHIAAIYGLEESDGVRALVMELVEGPTLAERIAAGAIPIEEWILPMEADHEHKAAPFLHTAFNEFQGQFCPGPEKSPKWVAYCSDESGRFEIYVQPFPGGSSSSGGKFQMSTGGGLEPRWRGDGKEIFYVAPNGTLMAVEVKTAPAFEVGVPKPLFDARVFGGAGSATYRYAVSLDGQRFLVDSFAQVEEGRAPITVVLNWLAAVKK